VERFYLYRDQVIGTDEELSESKRSFTIHPLIFIAAHIPLAYAMSGSSVISTLHAAATLIACLYFAVLGKKIEHVAYGAAYIIGAEVLWRMTGAQVPWEFGKYATSLIFIIPMARGSRLQGPLLPFLYFVLLLPSCVLTLINETLMEAREQISFNLSGPFALMVCALFFSHLRLSSEQLQNLRLALIAPVVGIASIALFTMMNDPDLVFTGESNSATSGGYGPNQVSAALGLGALMLFYFLTEARVSKVVRTILFALMLGLMIQSALTFSRGGLYNAIGGAVIGFIFLAKDARSIIKIILATALILGLANFVIIPRLDEFTNGALTARFENTDPTNRDHIIEADLQIWSEHPIFGVGPGQATIYRKAIMYGAVAHTEFSRLFAEHGFLGFMSLICLLLSGIRTLIQTNGSKARATKASLMTWSMLYMLNAAMRLAAPSFLFGFAFASLESEEESE